MSIKRTALAIAMLIILSLLAACSNELDAPPMPEPTGSDWTLQDGSGVCEPDGSSAASCRWQRTANSLIMHIEGQSFGTNRVFVEYRNEEAGQFRTQPVDTAAGRYDVNIARLKAETDYEFRVLGVGEVGEIIPGPTGRFRTNQLPEGLRRAEISVVGGASTSELTFMDFNLNEFDEQPAFYGLVGVDSTGEIVWYTETGETGPIARKDNGDFVFLEFEFGLKEINPLGELVSFVESPCSPLIVFHHEVDVLPNDRIMTLSFDIVDTFDDPSRLQVGDTIWVWDQPRASIGRVWNLLDFEDPSLNRTSDSDLSEGHMWKGCEDNQPTQDWSHGNSAKLAPEGSIIFSSRHLDQVHSIASDFGSIVWRLGGHGSDFGFPDSSDRFYHQHTAYQLPNGNVLLFDNGNTRPAEEGGQYSRALELSLDSEAMTVRKAWEYVPDPPLFAECCSSVERLENGNTLIVFGANFQGDVCCRRHTIVEAGPDQQTIWKVEIAAPGQEIIYRAYSGDSVLGEERITP